MGSIEKYLVPARVRVEYSPNPSSGKLERVCYVECANGEILTGSIPFEWAQFICKCLNHGRLIGGTREAEKEPVALLRIDGLPLQKTEAIVVGKEQGLWVAKDAPAYLASISMACALGEEIFMYRWTQLPIEKPVSISCTYNITGHNVYNLPLCNAWVLDLLEGLHIIKSKGHRYVKSMDGSRFGKVNDNPHTLIAIREWKG